MKNSSNSGDGYNVDDLITPTWKSGDVIKHEEVAKVVNDLYVELDKFQPPSAGYKAAGSTEYMNTTKETTLDGIAPVPHDNLCEEIEQLRYRIERLSPASTGGNAKESKWWSKMKGASVFSKKPVLASAQEFRITLTDTSKYYLLDSTVEKVIISVPEPGGVKYDFPEFVFLQALNPKPIIVGYSYGDGGQPMPLGAFQQRAIVLYSTNTEESAEVPVLLPFGVSDKVYDQSAEIKVTLPTSEYTPYTVTKTAPLYRFVQPKNTAEGITERIIFPEDILKKLDRLTVTIVTEGEQLRDNHYAAAHRYFKFGNADDIEKKLNGTYSYLILNGKAYETISAKDQITAVQPKKKWFERNDPMVWTNPSSLYPVLGGDSIGSEEEGCPFESDRLIWLFRGDAAPSTIQWWNADTSSYDEVLLETDYTVVVGGPGGVTTVWQYDIPVTTTPYVDIPKDGTTGEHAGLYRITTNATLSTDTGPFVEKDALIDVYNTTETSSQLKVRLADGTTPAAVINQPYAKVLLHRSLAPEVVMETGRGKSDYPQDLYVDVLENNPSWATYASVIRLHYKTLSYTANFLGDVRFYYTPRHTLFRLRYDNGALTGATIKRQKVTIQPTSAYDVSVYNDGEVWIFHNDSGTPDAVGGELVDYGSPVSNLDLTADLNVGHWAARYTIKYGATDTPAHLWRQVNGPTLKSMAPFKDALVQFYCPDIGTGSRTVQYLVADSSSSSPSFESIILKNMYELWHFARGQSAVRIMTSNISR